MYNVSEAYTEAAEARGRTILTKAILNETELGNSNIIELSVNEAVSSPKLSMGSTISAQLKLKIKAPDMPILLDGAVVKPYIGLGEEFCPLGKFNITKTESDNDFQITYTIIGYDDFSKTEVKYTPSITMPNTAQAIMEDIASQCNFSIAADIVYPKGNFEFYDVTCREYIGYFAGLVGKNARFNRDGELTFIWYTDIGYTVGRSLQYMSGFKRLADKAFEVQSITSGTAGNVIVSGSGVGFSFNNPFMTQDILDGILTSIGSVSFTPSQLKWRGNPAIEAGDIITAEDKYGQLHTVFVMEQTIKVSGGLYSEIKCYADTEAAMNFTTSPQAKKIQQIYNKLQDAITAATALLNGSNGGVFEVIDENSDGINDGWIIHSADGQKFIKANLGGIGITTDGGATYKQAMTADGINANAITTGQMNAQRLSVGDSSLGDVFLVELDEEGHPVIIIGSSQNDIKQRQTNSAIEFVDGADNTVAKFSITGAEWADMQQIKYCGFVWTKSEITGNVRFTKIGG